MPSALQDSRDVQRSSTSHFGSTRSYSAVSASQNSSLIVRSSRSAVFCTFTSNVARKRNSRWFFAVRIACQYQCNAETRSIVHPDPIPGSSPRPLSNISDQRTPNSAVGLHLLDRLLAMPHIEIATLRVHYRSDGASPLPRRLVTVRLASPSLMQGLVSTSFVCLGDHGRMPPAFRRTMQL